MFPQPLLLMEPIVKVLLPALAIAIVVLRLRARTPQWKQLLGLVTPLWPSFAFLIIVYAACMLGTNAFFAWRGSWDFTSWHRDSFLHDAERVIAVGILGPIAEELIFRGFFYDFCAAPASASLAPSSSPPPSGLRSTSSTTPAPCF